MKICSLKVKNNLKTTAAYTFFGEIMPHYVESIKRLVLTSIFLGFAVMANSLNPSFNQQQPENISDKKWLLLKAAIQEAKLTANDAIDDGYFGYSVSLSGDRALVGSYKDNDDNENGTDSGSAYIFDLIGGTWIQTSKLTASDATDFTNFGYSVSLSGNRALVGAIEDVDFGKGVEGDKKSVDRGGYVFGHGSAYIFDLVGGNWHETTKLVTNGGDRYRFGYSVSLLGNRALIGASLSDDSGSSSGSAYIFDLIGGVWTETEKLNANDADSGEYFGISVSLSEDRALIGAAFDDNNGLPFSGSAYIFDLTGGVWSETTKLTASDSNGNEYFGYSVSLSGNRALIGAYLDDENGNDSGSAYVFDLAGGLWSETTKLTASDAVADDNFGISVSLLGNRALIGVSFDDDNGVNSGSAYLFDFTGGNWSETKKLTANDAAAFEWFGYSVSLSGDRALIGAYLDDENGNVLGSAYVFGITPTGTLEPTIVPALNFTGLLLLSLLVLVFMRFNSRKVVNQGFHKQTN